jgi:hypothetical protein
MSSKHQTYRIRIKGHVGVDWSTWFDELIVEHTDAGETVLRGEIPDQTALHGVLMKIRDLGLVLVEVKSFDLESNA